MNAVAVISFLLEPPNHKGGDKNKIFFATVMLDNFCMNHK